MFKFASNVVHLALASLMLPTFALAGSCICLACAFDPKLENFRAVSESMSPTINTGECALMRHFDPLEDTIRRGDVIGFEPQPNQPILVFRVIAKAGDTISLSSGQIILNGQPIPQVFLSHDEIVFPPNPPFPRCEKTAQSGEVCTRSRLKEALPAGSSYEIFDTGITRGDDMAEITVSPSHIFVMGDHRDNAFDSRFNRQMGGPGAVELGSVIGIFDDP
jgi:signal peptidase I